VWELGPPAKAVSARERGAHDALAAVIGPNPDDDALTTAATVMRRAMGEVSPAGRALFGANQSLPWPEPPLRQLWHALTLVREHRGDGHNAALTAAGISGCGAHVLAAATGGAPRSETQPARGWSDDDWDLATDRLRSRALLAPDGQATPAGHDLHEAIERRTDELAWEPWRAVDLDAFEALVGTLARLAGRVAAAGVLRFPNPMGLPAPP
jgi:hypothetical protein